MFCNTGFILLVCRFACVCFLVWFDCLRLCLLMVLSVCAGLVILLTCDFCWLLVVGCCVFVLICRFTIVVCLIVVVYMLVFSVFCLLLIGFGAWCFGLPGFISFLLVAIIWGMLWIVLIGLLWCLCCFLVVYVGLYWLFLVFSLCSCLFAVLDLFGCLVLVFIFDVSG